MALLWYHQGSHCPGPLPLGRLVATLTTGHQLEGSLQQPLSRYVPRGCRHCFMCLLTDKTVLDPSWTHSQDPLPCLEQVPFAVGLLQLE